MTTSISMPQLGESVAEGTIGRWLKAPGERVERDEPIVEVITDKVNAEIPSPVAGVLERIVVPEGETVSVGAEIAVIGDGSAAAGEPAESAPTGAGAGATAPGGPTGAGAPSVENVPSEEASPALVAEIAASGTGSQAAESSLSLLRDEAAPGGQAPTQVSPTVTPSRPNLPGTNGAPKRASPFVRSLARKYGIDLGRVTGTGLGGRVTKDDILQFIERAGATPVAEQPAAATAAPTAAPSAPTAPPVVAPSAPAAPPISPRPSASPPSAPAPTAQPAAPAASQPLGADEELVPLLPMRRAIAEHMVRSVQTSPHAWSMVEIDVTRLVKLRASLVERWKAREGFELTYLPFFVKAVVEALRENPILNARWSDQGAVLKKRINIGIAVAIDNGLVVPVIRDADQKSISGIAREIRELATRARGGRLTMDDLQGGTFTVNNTGALGSIASGPIINQPQAGIITMEAIVKRPVVTDDDAIAIRSMMNSCLSFDHRVLDGAEVLRFLQSVKRRMEGYGPDTTIY
ncbi:MAG: 2-oxo acid dehydrogenase subunit E2 [Chloroflexota bacterium]|nr:2-oxo acid dehydrogenase subunit E2 [Chloroflexota bacterium]